MIYDLMIYDFIFLLEALNLAPGGKDKSKSKSKSKSKRERN